MGVCHSLEREVRSIPVPEWAPGAINVRAQQQRVGISERVEVAGVDLRLNGKFPPALPLSAGKAAGSGHPGKSSKKKSKRRPGKGGSSAGKAPKKRTDGKPGKKPKKKKSRKQKAPEDGPHDGDEGGKDESEEESEDGEEGEDGSEDEKIEGEDGESQESSEEDDDEEDVQDQEAGDDRRTDKGQGRHDYPPGTMAARIITATAIATGTNGVPTTGECSRGVLANKIAALNDRFCDVVFRQDPYTCYQFGVRRYEDDVFDESPDMQAFAATEFRAIRAAARDLVDDADAACNTLEDKADLDFLIDACDTQLCWEDEPEEVRAFGRLLRNSHFTGTLASLPWTIEAFQPVETPTDLHNYRRRLEKLPGRLSDVVDIYREGIATGLTLPPFSVNRLIDFCELQARSSAEDSGLNRRAEAKRLLGDADYLTQGIRGVQSAFAHIRDFLQAEYLPHARASDGLAGLPGHSRAYEIYIFEATTLRGTTAAELHALGRKEVSRIEKEMETVVRERVGFAGTVREFQRALQDRETFPHLYFQDRAEVIPAYQLVVERARERMDGLFSRFPKFSCAVRPVPEESEASSGAGYYQTGTETTPGTFFANVGLHMRSPKHTMTSVALHEANPGHHHQFSLALENSKAHTIRKLMGNPAYSEGWGLYAEFLGEEMGMLSDPFDYFGRLENELLRACRLAVDTGLHAFGWTLKDSIDYMTARVSGSLDGIAVEAERYAVFPARALGYKVGELRIKELRATAERELGPDLFDVASFHEAVVGAGMIGFGTLETVVRRWIDEIRGGFGEEWVLVPFATRGDEKRSSNAAEEIDSKKGEEALLSTECATTAKMGE
ncbi:hypothetical protein DFJ73DRAFT_958949 [Zopfochytrium polystomum]|nr:hypothetical protein DFJ73DRAFT_958949 [Zopfochytrium polystomum]